MLRTGLYPDKSLIHVPYKYNPHMNHIFYIVGYMWVVCGSYLGYMLVILENDSLLARIYQAVNRG